MTGTTTVSSALAVVVTALLLCVLSCNSRNSQFFAEGYYCPPHAQRYCAVACAGTRSFFVHSVTRVPFLSDSRQPLASALKAEIDDDEGSYNEVSDDDEMMDMMRSFKDRQSELLKKEERKSIKLRKAACTSGVSLVLSDWVRRLDVDFPLAVCGSASGSLYLAHLETGQVLGSTAAAAAASMNEAVGPPKNAKITEARVEHVVNQLYGRFDGGGTLAVCVKGDLVAESRRTGGVHVWRLNPMKGGGSTTTSTTSSSASVELVSQGFMPSLQDCLVTVLRLEDDYLWVGTDDGSVEAYALGDESSSQLPLTLRTQPDLSWKVGSESSVVMSLDVCTKLGCAVVATDTGTVELLSFEDDDDDDEDQQLVRRKPIGSFTPPFDGTERRSSNVYPTCVTFVASKNKNNGNAVNDSGIKVDRPPAITSYSIACGANDGNVFLQSLRMDDGDEIDAERPFTGQRIRQLMPKHFAAVKCMASPAPGLLLTGGLDGTLRLWDTDLKSFLYQFVGYKVWLGSLWTDGERIVTDGTDNTIIVHDFSGSSPDRRGSSSYPEDQKEDNDV